MTPKEKAQELFNKMYLVDDPMGNYPMCFDTAKQCALIAVDEMLEYTKRQTYNQHNWNEITGYRYDEFWQQVKNEIERL